MVYNCTTGGINPFHWGEIGKRILRGEKKLSQRCVNVLETLGAHPQLTYIHTHSHTSTQYMVFHVFLNGWDCC